MKKKQRAVRWLSKWGWIFLYIMLMSGAVFYILHGGREPIESSTEEKITLTFRHFWIKEHAVSLMFMSYRGDISFSIMMLDECILNRIHPRRKRAR